MATPKLVLVGGFLGSGKTTLLAQASKMLIRRGSMVGLITNDQASDLVDTGILRLMGLTVEEIAGGCFCCRFDELVSAASKLIEDHQPDVLMGEPVGSCTDISATVLQPLKDHHAGRFDLAPFSVLVDPRRLQELLDPRSGSSMHPSARYILRKQLEEADIILLNKIDLLSQAERTELEARAGEEFHQAEVRAISALSGEGVEVWLNEALERRPAGEHIVPVDYDVYAEGEAALGWLNALIRVSADEPADWQQFCRDLLLALRDKCRTANAEIAHLKLILRSSGDSYIVGNLTSNADKPRMTGSVTPSATNVELTINARVEIAPDELEQIVRAALEETYLAVEIVEMVSLTPGRPRPTYRYESVI